MQLPTPEELQPYLEELQAYPSSVTLSWLTNPKSVAYQLGMVFEGRTAVSQEGSGSRHIWAFAIITQANESPTTTVLAQMA
jgi:hypothetical protein